MIREDRKRFYLRRYARLKPIIMTHMQTAKEVEIPRGGFSYTNWGSSLGHAFVIDGININMLFVSGGNRFLIRHGMLVDIDTLDICAMIVTDGSSESERFILLIDEDFDRPRSKYQRFRNSWRTRVLYPSIERGDILILRVNKDFMEGFKYKNAYIPTEKEIARIKSNTISRVKNVLS